MGFDIHKQIAKRRAKQAASPEKLTPPPPDNEVFKMEVKAKTKGGAVAGILLLTELVRSIANPTLYDRQCSIEENPITFEGGSRLYPLRILDSIAFLGDKQRRDRELCNVLYRDVCPTSQHGPKPSGITSGQILPKESKT